MSLRRANEVKDITAFEATEKHSVFAKPENADLLAGYLRSKGVKFTREPNAVGGEDNLLIDKETPFDVLMGHINDWKKQYADAGR